MTTQDFTGRLALTRVETSHFLGISPATVDRLAKRGLLQPSRATRRPLYAMAELQRFMAETAGLPVSATFPMPNGTGGSSQRKGVK